MKKTTALFLGIVITLFPVALILILLSNLRLIQNEFPNMWTMVVHWTLTSLIILLAVWIVFHNYSKLMKMLFEQQAKLDKLRKQEELEKQLAELHHEYKMKAMDYEIRVKELELEKLKIEKKKG